MTPFKFKCMAGASGEDEYVKAANDLKAWDKT